MGYDGGQQKRSSNENFNYMGAGRGNSRPFSHNNYNEPDQMLHNEGEFPAKIYTIVFKF